MEDREKVIKGLEHCSSGEGCKGCPYNKTESGHACSFDCINDALALLKEQEAVPVVQREVMHMLVWCCGSCGVAITDGDKFCRNCGREVKWDGLAR